jgi:Fic family protein
MINNTSRATIRDLKTQYEQLRVGKEALLSVISEAELPELVYNSNAIENSTLTLRETERILLELSVSRDVSVRELFEAKNLARVMEYLRDKPNFEISIDNILLLHKMLIGGINDDIAGRLRAPGEYVRVGTHVAPPPEQMEQLLGDLLVSYRGNIDENIVERISRFHLEFERIHPFNDGNGRIGRLLINVELGHVGFPPVIIRNKGKRDYYYPAFREYQDDRKTMLFDRVLALAVTESLNKRISYLKGQEIIKLADFAVQSAQSTQSLLNAARRQSIPAFREKGVWKIGISK